jgi:hypothetical protein
VEQTDEYLTFALNAIDVWNEIEVGERFDTYQTVAVENLAYPLTVEAISFRAKNGTTERQLYYVYVVVEDAATGTVLGQTQIRMIQLEADEIATVAFTGQEIDVADCASVHLVFVLGEGTTGPLLIGGNGSAPIGGLFRLMGVAQPSIDAWVNVTTKVNGRTSGGEDSESDFEYRSRQMNALARAGAGTPEAIASQLWAIEGVRHVRVDYNPTLVVDGRGVDPKSVRVTIAGGSVREIATALLTRGVGAGIGTCGADMIAIENPLGGPAVPISFERPSEVTIYVRARVTLDRPSVLTDDIKTAISDAIIAYVGGPASDGTYHAGLAPAESVSIARIHAAICSVSGVKTAVVRISRVAIPLDEDNQDQAVDLALGTYGPIEIAVTRSSVVEVL